MTELRWRRYQFFILAVGAAVVLAGMGSGAGAAALAKPRMASRVYQIAIINTVGNTFNSAITAGFRAEAKGKPVKITLFDPGTDPRKEFNEIQDVTATKKFQGLAVLPIDPVSIIPALKEAVKAGIKVVTFNNPLGANNTTMKPQVPGMVANVMDSTSPQRGVWLAQTAIAACKNINPCRTWYIAGIISLAGEEQVIAGYKSALKGHPNVQLTGTSSAGGYDAQHGQAATQNLLTAHPNLNVIVASDQPLHGAQLAVASAGLTGKVKLIGLGGSTNGVASVRDGKWFGTVVTVPYSVGQATFDILLKGLETGVKGVAVDVLQKYRIDPKITAANAVKFKPQWAG